jgi:hypothetical protein
MTDTPTIHMIAPSSIVDVAKIYGRALCRSLAAAGETDMRGCLVDLVMGRRQLWGVFDEGVAGPVALFRTEIVMDQAEASHLQVSALAGRDLRRWAHLLSEQMKEEARNRGCKAVRFAGRDAWGRVLPEYRPVGAVNGETIFEVGV